MQCKRGVLTLKYPIEHVDNGSGMYKAEVASNVALDAVLPSIVGGYNMPGIMVGMDQKDRNYDFSLLSGDLDIDPIIDEPMDTSAALVVAQDIPAGPIVSGSHLHGVWVRPDGMAWFPVCWKNVS